MKKIEVGDTIEVIDDNLKAEVMAIDGEILTVMPEDGFELQFHSSEVIKVQGELDVRTQHIDAILREKQSPKKKSVRVKPKERDLPKMEVDLHIHQLVPSSKGMTNHEMLTIQLDTAKRQLEFAIRKRIQKVVFIHGVGEGVLKLELEYLFGRYDNVKYYDADYQKYGLGATEVYIFQNP